MSLDPLDASRRSGSPTRGPAMAVLGAAALWAIIGVFTTELGRRGHRAPSVAFWRALGGGVCFVAHAVATRRRFRVERARRPALAAFTVIGVSVFYLALPAAVQAGGITLAYVLLYTAPMWVAVGVVALGHGRADASMVIVTVVSVAGVIAVVMGSGSGIEVTPAALAWGTVAGGSYACYYLVGRPLFDAVDPIVVYAIALPVGSLPLGVASGFAVPHLADLPYVVGLCVVSTWAPYLLLSIGLRGVAPHRAVIIATAEPVIAAAFARVFYGEHLGPVGLAGGALVLLAGLWASLR